MSEDSDEKVAKSKSRKKPVTVLLDDPIQWGDELIEKIVVQPAKGKHLRGLPDKPTMNDILKIASKLSGTSSAVFDEMSSGDVLKVVEAVGELL